MADDDRRLRDRLNAALEADSNPAPYVSRVPWRVPDKDYFDEELQKQSVRAYTPVALPAPRRTQWFRVVLVVSVVVAAVWVFSRG